MGWPQCKLEDLCVVFTDGDWIESKNQSSEGIRLIQTGNVGEGCFKSRREKARYISEETFSALKCCEIYEGDCLVSRLPDPVGRSCILPDTGDRMITAVDCTILRFKKDKIESSYFNYYSQSTDYLNAVESMCSGATRKRISRKNLGLVKVPLPPIPEQKRIVATLDQAFGDIEKARANAVQNLKNARELFDSYLQQAFSQKGTEWVEKCLEECMDVWSSKRIYEADWTESGVPFYGGKEVVKLARGDSVVSNAYISEEKYTEYAGKYEMPQEGDILMTARGLLVLVT